MNIVSPMPWGNGAHVVHSLLQKRISGYKLFSYNPKWELMPLAFPFLVDTAGADLIHATPDYATFFAKRNIPLVLSFQNYVLDPFMRTYSSFVQKIHYATDLRLFHRKAINKAHTITAVSRFTADIVKRDLDITSDIEIIYNGIDTNRFIPENHQSDRTIRVLFSGNLSKRKGAQWLDEIAAYLQPNIEIVVTGGLMKRSMKFDNPRIKLIEGVPYESMHDLYNSANILLFPTVREGLSLAAMEAMACGLPIIASDCSSMPELVVEGKGGHLCELGKVEAFSQAINSLADSPSTRKIMGQYNRERVVEMFSLDKMVSGYRSLFEKVLS